MTTIRGVYEVAIKVRDLKARVGRRKTVSRTRGSYRAP